MLDTQTTPKPLKAYMATDYDRDHTVVVFGTRNDWALRKEAAGQIDGDPDSIDSLTRAPGFDHLANEHVTAQHYIEIGGLHYECHCGVKITASMEEAQDNDEDNREFDGPAYHALRPDEVWCSSQCRDNDMTARFEAKALAFREHTMGSELALKKWPGITITRCQRRDYSKPETLEVSFTFPGIGKYENATWVVGNSSSITLPRSAVSAWYAFTAELLNAQDRDPGDEHLHRISK